MAITGSFPMPADGVKLPPQVEEEWIYSQNANNITALAVAVNHNVYSGSTGKAINICHNDGTHISTVSGFDGSITAICCVADGSFLCGSELSSLYKYDRTNSEIWSLPQNSGTIQAIITDQSNDIIAGMSGCIRKISSAGEQIWEYVDASKQFSAFAVETDSDNNIYATVGSTLNKLDSNGAVIWSFTGFSLTVISAKLSSDGYIYASSEDLSIKKINSSGDELWSLTVSQPVTLDCDKQNNIYAVNSKQICKFADSSRKLWCLDFSDNTKIVCDTQGRFYTAGNDQLVHKWKQIESVLYSTNSADSPEPLQAYQIDWGAGDISPGTTLSFAPHTIDSFIIDSHSFIYVATTQSKLLKTSLNGVEIKTITPFTYNARIYNLSFDENENIYAVYAGVIKKFDSHLNVILSISSGSVGVLPDFHGSFYTVKNASIQKYTTGGDLLWEKAIGATKSVTLYGPEKDGNLYGVADYTTLKKFDNDMNVIWSTVATEDKQVISLAEDNHGFLYCGESYCQRYYQGNRGEHSCKACCLFGKSWDVQQED